MPATKKHDKRTLKPAVASKDVEKANHNWLRWALPSAAVALGGFFQNGGKFPWPTSDTNEPNPAFQPLRDVRIVSEPPNTLDEIRETASRLENETSPVLFRPSILAAIVQLAHMAEPSYYYDLPDFNGVRVLNQKRFVFQVLDEMRYPLSKFLPKRNYTTTNMPPREFFENIKQSLPQKRFLHATIGFDDHPKLAEDVGPDLDEALRMNKLGIARNLDELMAGEPKRKSMLEEVLKITNKRNIWITNGAVTSETHYDCDHNLYHVLRGSKVFYLAAPEQLLHMKMVPRVHPSDRQSQLSWDQVTKRGVHVEEVLVKAGESLFVPAFWFHRVTSSEELSIAMNFWSDSVDQTWYNRFLNTHPGPIYHHHLLPEIRSKEEYERFVTSVKHVMYGAMDKDELLSGTGVTVRQFICETVLHDQYDGGIPLEARKVQPGFSCMKQAELGEDMGKMVNQSVDYVVKNMGRLSEGGPRLIFFQYWFETTLQRAIGIESLYYFVDRCICEGAQLPRQ